MKTIRFISQTERNLLIGLILSLCAMFYAHFTISQIEEFNQNIKTEQAKKSYEANTPPGERISLSSCFWAPPLITQIFWLQFFTNPLWLLILWKPKPFAALLVLFADSIITFSLFCWIWREYQGYVLNELYWLHAEPMGYFALYSHISSLLLALLSMVFLIIQIWMLARFAVERFQAKISLR